MSAAVDPLRALYMVAVPSADPTTSVFLYNYAQGRWATAPLTAELIFSAFSLASSLEDVDALHGTIDTAGLALDGAAYRGGVPTMMAFDGGHRLGTLSGAAVAATIADATRELTPGARSRIRSVRPLTDAAQASVAVAGANALGDAWIETDYDGRRANGAFRCRENWRLTRITLSIPAGTRWTQAQGYDADVTAGGRP
jgi:hypothetical protein